MLWWSNYTIEGRLVKNLRYAVFYGILQSLIFGIISTGLSIDVWMKSWLCRDEYRIIYRQLFSHMCNAVWHRDWFISEVLMKDTLNNPHLDVKHIIILGDDWYTENQLATLYRPHQRSFICTRHKHVYYRHLFEPWPGAGSLRKRTGFNFPVKLLGAMQ